MRWSAIPLVLLAASMPIVAAQAHRTDDGVASLEMSSSMYAWPTAPLVEPICFTWRNGSDHTLWWPNTAPWRVEDADGNVVSSHGALQAFVPMGPGRSATACWDGVVVLPGEYRVIWEYYDLEGPSPDVLRELQLDFVLQMPA